MDDVVETALVLTSAATQPADGAAESSLAQLIPSEGEPQPAKKRRRRPGAKTDGEWKKRSRGVEEKPWISFRATHCSQQPLRFLHARNLLARLQHEVHARRWSMASSIHSLLLRESNHCIAALAQVRTAPLCATTVRSRLPSPPAACRPLRPRLTATLSQLGYEILRAEPYERGSGEHRLRYLRRMSRLDRAHRKALVLEQAWETARQVGTPPPYAGAACRRCCGRC